MAGSDITKKALAASMKALMAEKPFHKITISDICDGCGMNRKSFYYHFLDKYDLVNWIYDTEFYAVYGEKEYSTSWEFMDVLCRYLESERDFYSHAFKISGQNSFPDHFTEMMDPILRENLQRIFGDSANAFHVTFFFDAFVMAIKRWLTEMEDIRAEEFVTMLKSMVYRTAEKTYAEMME